MVDLATNRPIKAQKFDKKELEAEDLYRWTSLRSGYLAEANVDYAPDSFGGNGWFGEGWYWDPWFDAYTFLPGDGIFFSPFGWVFIRPGVRMARPSTAAAAPSLQSGSSSLGLRSPLQSAS